MTQPEALVRIARAAVASERATGVPAELTASQCIFESAWLNRAPGNNCFGIKDTDRLPGVQYKLTQEFINGTWHTQRLAFEVYPSLQACFEDHGRLISTGRPYRAFFEAYRQDRNLDALITSVASKYATSPIYAKQITAMARSPKLQAALAKERTGPILSPPLLAS